MNNMNYYLQETSNRENFNTIVVIMEVNSSGKGAEEVEELKDVTLPLSDAMRVTAALNRADQRGWTEHKACVIQLTNKRREDLCPT